MEIIAPVGFFEIIKLVNVYKAFKMVYIKHNVLTNLILNYHIAAYYEG